FALGTLKIKAHPTPEDGAARPEDGLAAIVGRYNDMFGRVYDTLMREVGPISEHLLARSLRRLEETHPVVFHRASLGGDGTVDAALLQENVRSLGGAPGRDLLI